MGFTSNVRRHSFGSLGIVANSLSFEITCSLFRLYAVLQIIGGACSQTSARPRMMTKVKGNQGILKSGSGPMLEISTEGNWLPLWRRSDWIRTRQTHLPSFSLNHCILLDLSLKYYSYNCHIHSIKPFKMCLINFA